MLLLHAPGGEGAAQQGTVQGTPAGGQGDVGGAAKSGREHLGTAQFLLSERSYVGSPLPVTGAAQRSESCLVPPDALIRGSQRVGRIFVPRKA